jgi:hypothetical protein
MSNKIELENEELLKGMMSTFDDMFSKIFPSKMFCEAEGEEDDDDDKDQ